MTAPAEDVGAGEAGEGGRGPVEAQAIAEAGGDGEGLDPGGDPGLVGRRLGAVDQPEGGVDVGPAASWRPPKRASADAWRWASIASRGADAASRAAAQAA
ncbi:MAG: hypothetical protein H6710_14930 [Myxococcales bacterium]|nr:hypothetical protein [Myxococcales bacterium]